jgi:hypothetical protein
MRAMVARLPRVACAILYAVGTAACSRSVGVDELAGLYRANHELGTDLVDVQAGGTYIHRFTRNGTAVSEEGTWQIESDPHLTVTFNRFRWVDGVGSAQPGFWVVTPVRRWGRVNLPIDEDKGFFYVK